MNAIMNNIAYAIEHITQDPEARGSLSHLTQSETKREVLREIASLGGNAVCADCGSPGEDI
jgi:hypothetical protein